MRSYDEYKESNVAWLGEIPAHWEESKIAALFVERKTKVSDKDYQPLSVTKLGVVPQLETAAKSDDSDNRKLVCVGDFVINSRSDRKGSCGVSDFTGSVSLINIVLTPRNSLHSRYVHYLLRSHPFSEEYYRNGKGIVADLWTTRYSEMKSILLPVPSLSEQEHIAKFLDYKISRIEKLISIRQQQIKDLEDLKKALINRAVTREGWKVVKLKHLFKIFSGATPDSGNPEYWDGNIIWVTPADFQTKDKYIYRGAKCITESGFKACSTSLVPSGSIIFSKRAPVGKVAISKVDLCTNQGCLACVPLQNVIPEFFYYVMSVCTGEFEKLSAGTTFKEISLAKFKDFLLPLPPITEQIQIAEYLDKKCSLIDRALINFSRQIETLNALKARLISDSVTGRIDLRHVRIPESD